MEEKKSTMVNIRVPSLLKSLIIDVATKDQNVLNPNLSKFILLSALKGMGFKDHYIKNLNVKGLGVKVTKCVKCACISIYKNDDIMVCPSCFTFYKTDKANNLLLMNDLKGEK